MTAFGETFESIELSRTSFLDQEVRPLEIAQAEQDRSITKARQFTGNERVSDEEEEEEEVPPGFVREETSKREEMTR